MVSVRTSGQLVLDELLHFADGAAGSLAGAVRRLHGRSSPGQGAALAELAALCMPSKIGRRIFVALDAN